MITINPLKLCCSLITLATLTACGGGGGGGGADPQTPDPGAPQVNLDTPRDLFKPDEVLDVQVQMNEADWLALRADGPQLTDWNPSCVFEGFDFHKATVTIDGEEVDNVDIRSKGWIGSLNILRPSLKLNYGRGEEFEDRTFHGDKRLTLNNNTQDPSNIKQCLAFSIFSAAGIHAPRCNFARVTAQGEDRGVYSHVEGIKKPFLERTFGDDSGTLFELQRDGEFNLERLPFFQVKTNEDEHDPATLEAVVTALSASDDTVLDELNQVINMEQFINYSVVEALVGHTDGYNGFQNNVYIYQNPNDNGRLHFIPWGTDQTFIKNFIFPGAPITTPSVMQGSELMTRLWQVPEFRTQYDNRMREVLADVWDEEAFVSEARRMAALVGGDEQAQQNVIDFIEGRRAEVEAELDTERPWEFGLLGEVTECAVATPISGSFDVLWGDTFASSGEFNVTINGETYSRGDFGSSGAGPQPQGRPDYSSVVLVGFSGSTDEPPLLVAMDIPDDVWGAGVIPFHSIQIQGFVGKLLPDNGFEFLGNLTEGSMDFESADNTEGGQVKGTFDAVYVIP